MTESITASDLFEFNAGKHGTARTIEVTCLGTGRVVARFDFEEEESSARKQAIRFAQGLAVVYDSGASLDLLGLTSILIANTAGPLK